MQSTKISSFFSCSFHKEDLDIVKPIHSLCNGLGIECINVDKAYCETPPEKARELIKKSQIFIGVATCRVKAEDGDFLMPQAVNDEISMAYGIGKPILLIVEENIKLDGLMPNYCAYMKFSRENIFNPETIEKLVSSIHQIKLKVITPYDLIDLPGNVTSPFYESIYRLISLEPYWPDVLSKIEKDAPNLFWDIKKESSSKKFEINYK